MDFAAIPFHHGTMPEFMEQLDNHGTDVDPANIRRRKEPMSLVPERIEILDAVLYRNNNRRKPNKSKRNADQDVDKPLELAQNELRVKNWNFQEEYVQERGLDLFLHLLLVAVEQHRTVIHALVQEHVRLVQLRKHLDDFALARHVFHAAVQQFIPDFTHCLAGTQLGNKFVRPLRQTVILIRKRFIKNIPQNTTIRLTVDADTRPKSDFTLRKPIPRFMEYLSLLVKNHQNTL